MLSRNAWTSCRRPNASLQAFGRSLATEVLPESSHSPTSAPLPHLHTKRPPRPQVSTAVIVNRSPILTRTPTLFERAYYAYQARIRRALHNPFPYDFYFKQGSLLETGFNLEERKRERRAFGPSFGSSEFVSAEKIAAEKAAEEQLALQEGEGQNLMPRVHSADTNRDLKSLDRKGRRNIYLLLHTVENAKEVWRFPQGGVEKGELLHQAAQRDLHAECGAYMDSWIVSRVPIGVYKPSISVEPAPEQQVTFFFKAHIMAGQARPQGEAVQDFAWLTKQEIETRVQPEYWNSVRDILSDH